MGSISTEGTALAQFNPFLLSLPVSPGMLTTLTCFCTESYSDSCHAYIEIGTIGNLADIMTRSGALASGYAGHYNSLSFSGQSPIVVDDYIYALIRSATAINFRLLARITPFSAEEKLIRGIK